MIARIHKVSIKGATKLFTSVRAISNVSLELNAGEIIAVMGSNGAGKSTLLSVLSLRARPTRGQVLFNDKKADSDMAG